MTQTAQSNPRPGAHGYAADPLPLLCVLGRHSPERLPVWNEGYYFARCERCHRDIVRPLDGKWEIPRGFRVVWQRERPETEPTPVLVDGEHEPRLPFPPPPADGVDERAGNALAATEQAASPDGVQDGAPAEAGLDDSGPGADEIDHSASYGDAEPEHPAPGPDDSHGEVMAWTAQHPDAEAAETAEAASDEQTTTSHDAFADDAVMDGAEPAPEEPVYEEPVDEQRPWVRTSLIPDFMNDGAPLPAPLIPHSAPVASSPTDTAARSLRSELDRIGLGNLASMTNRVFQDRTQQSDSPARQAWRGPSGTVGAVIVAVLLTMVTTIAWERRQLGRATVPAQYQPPKALSGPPQVTPPAAEAAAAAVAPSPPVKTAPAPQPSPSAKAAALRGAANTDRIVVASVLNCRATPAPAAPVRMKFLRGAVVTMETQRGNWVSISRHGQSCWVQSQLIEGS